MDLMRGNLSHPTADEIYALARRKEPRISRGTVYRNLHFLVEAGEIARISVPGSPDHFDSCLAEHHHLHCRRCGRLLDVPGVVFSLEQAVAASLARSGFVIEGVGVIFKGLCPDCSGAASRSCEE
ncbi:MAG: transcriptional repressor [Treponemataceae bacterium]|nr:transcriptional repressor [Treponemataceae bacterium]